MKIASPLAAVAAAVASFSAAAAPPHSFAGKVALYSEYEYRGIAQTSEDPALQLTLDYAHASGFYAGTFLSNVKWLEDTGERLGLPSDGKLEWDLYGGYKWRFGPGWAADVGVLRYEFPGSDSFGTALGRPDTTEVYAGVSYGPAAFRYSYATTGFFGVPDSKGSDYVELSVKHPVMEKLTLNAVLGHQRYKGTQQLDGGRQWDNGQFDYTVWKLGATYEIGNGFTAGAYYKGTSAEPAYFTFLGKDWSRDRLVGFVAYSF